MSELKKSIRGILKENEPMSKHTSFGIGGPTHAYITPADIDDLKTILDFAVSHDIQTYVAGSGSNLLVSDRGFDGILITLQNRFKTLRISGSSVYTESGVMLGHLVKECIKHNLTGLESLIGVPGTLGGALIMNAGAFGGEISTFLQWVEVMDLKGTRTRKMADKIQFGYRSSSFSREEIILSAQFELEVSDPNTIHDRKSKASRGRKSQQPLRARSAGSVFKNPAQDLAAGYLIDQAGLKGTTRGDAEISTKHANFFINRGKATASDMVDLIRLARMEVYKKFNIRLELEIQTLGFEKNTFEILPS